MYTIQNIFIGVMINYIIQNHRHSSQQGLTCFVKLDAIVIGMGKFAYDDKHLLHRYRLIHLCGKSLQSTFPLKKVRP